MPLKTASRESWAPSVRLRQLLSQTLATRPRLLEAAAASLPVGYFLTSCLSHLRTPALYQDELLFISPALGTHRWQPMLMTYVGALKALIYAPITGLFGVSVASIRVPSVLLATSALLFFYSMMRRLTNPAFAWVALLMMSMDAAYGFYARVDVAPGVMSQLLKSVALWSFVRYAEGEKVGYLWATTLALILGIYDKLNFIWFLNALCFAALLAHGRRLVGFLARRKLAVLLPLIVLAAVVAFTFFSTIRPMFELDRRREGSPTDYRERIPFIFQLAADTMDGVATYHYWILEDEIPRRGIFLVLSGILLLNGTSALLGHREASREEPERSGLRWLGFLATTEAVILLQMILTKAAYGAHNAMLVWPLPHLAATLAAFLAIRGVENSRVAKVVIGLNILALGWVLRGDVAAGTAYAKAYAGGTSVRPPFDRRVYDLSEFVNARLERVDSVTTPDPGLTQPLRVLAPPAARMDIGTLWQPFDTQPQFQSEIDLLRFMRRHFPRGTTTLVVAFKGEATSTGSAGNHHWHVFLREHLSNRISAHADIRDLFEAWCISTKDDCGMGPSSGS